MSMRYVYADLLITARVTPVQAASLGALEGFCYESRKFFDCSSSPAGPGCLLTAVEFL